jgi:hypothetical protein
MRVYEFAKAHGIASKSVMALAKSLGIDARSASHKLSPQDAARLTDAQNTYDPNEPQLSRAELVEAIRHATIAYKRAILRSDPRGAKSTKRYLYQLVNVMDGRYDAIVKTEQHPDSSVWEDPEPVHGQPWDAADIDPDRGFYAVGHPSDISQWGGEGNRRLRDDQNDEAGKWLKENDPDYDGRRKGSGPRIGAAQDRKKPAGGSPP